MNKFGVVLGIAAVATLAGCKDPDFPRTSGAQNEPKNVDTTPVPVKPVAVETAVPKCKCAPGTKHAAPCTCGAPDCKCIVETKPIIVADVSKKPAEPEYTIYVVQNGDYLAKISKKFNVTISSIKRLNPSIKKDVVRVGQKLKIPGRHDIPVVSAAPKAATTAVKKASKKAVATAYTGATKEYVVKSGDTLGSIAYGNGINIRQLKELNGMSSDVLRVGQKLKIPAEKVVAAKKATKAADGKKVEVKKADEKKAEEKPQEAQSKPEEKAEEKPQEAQPKADEPQVEAKPEEANAADAASAAPESQAAVTYVVKEGDDITGVAIHWGVSSAAIRELNNLGENDQLVPGQIIKLPPEAQQ